MINSKGFSMHKNFFIDKIYSFYFTHNTGLKKFFFLLFRKRKIRKFCNDLKSRSPDFKMLWQIAEFIKLSEYIFFYNNTQKSYLYSSNNYKQKENGFIVNDVNSRSRIVVKLMDLSENNDPYCRVDVEITRNDSQSKTLLSFVNNCWMNNYGDDDEMLLDRTIDIIMKKVVRLFYECCEMCGEDFTSDL